jgi:SAM-dependent methyltransferase
MGDNAVYKDEVFVREYADLWFDDRAMLGYLDVFARELPTPGAVLDAGCGPGRDVLALTERGVEALGIDTSPAMLAEARRLTDGRVPPSRFRLMDIRRLDFGPKMFAGVWSSGVLHHLREDAVRVVLAEFNRVLVLDGLLFLAVEAGTGEKIDDVGRYRKFYESDDARAVLDRAGFRVVRDEVSMSVRSTTGRPKAKRWLTVFARKSAARGAGPDSE